MTGPEAAEFAALVDAHAAARAQLAAAAAAAAAAAVRGMTAGAWWDSAATATLAKQVAAAVQATQRQTAATTDAYLARVLTVMRGRPVRPVGPVPVDGLRAGVRPTDVYGRLADTYRRLTTTEQLDDAAALERVATRAEAMADTDVVLAFRAQAHKVMAVREVNGWRRIVRPELSAGGTCGLCIVASDRWYSRGDLLAIHARCKCDVLPIINRVDPGASLNTDDLNALYAAAGANTAAELKKTRYVVHQHGELGPVLRLAGHNFRGPDEVPG